MTTLDPQDQPEDDGGYELAVPFVIVQSAGGPYDDDAFVAGFELGGLDERLKLGAELGAGQVGATLHTAGLRQAELIAMHRGFPVVHAVDHEDGTWSTVTFQRHAEQS